MPAGMPPPPAGGPSSLPGRRRRRPLAAALGLLLVLSAAAAPAPARAQDADDPAELARIASVTTLLDLSSPTPAVSGAGALAFAGGRLAAAAAEGGQAPASPEEADAAYDAVQAEVEARLEMERAEALRVLDLARQANRRVSAPSDGAAEEQDAASAPSADEVALAEAVADNPWRAHRCTTAHPSEEARDEMDAAVRAHLEQEQRELDSNGGNGNHNNNESGGGGARRRLRRLLHRALHTAADPFDVDFTPDPYAGLSPGAVAAAAERARSNPTVVHTYFHVVSPSSTAGPKRGDIADATLLAQLRVLNSTYGSAGFQFKLEAVTRVVSSSFATAEVASDAERAMKRALRRGGRDALNIYITSPPALLGWSSFPESARDDRDYDGVVIGFYTLPGSMLKPYNMGMTMAHEVGHWLGLLHTFEGQACSGLGDRVGDTPRESAPAFGCPAHGSVDSCPSDPGADSTSNFMQYTDDACMSGFTPGQVARMAALWKQYRASPGAVAAAAREGGGDNEAAASASPDGGPEEQQQQQPESGRASTQAPTRRRRRTGRGG